MLAARRLDEELYLPKVETTEVASRGGREQRHKTGSNRRLFLRYLTDLGMILVLAVLVLSRTVVLESENYRLDRLNQTLAVAQSQNERLFAELAQQEASGNLPEARATLGLIPPTRVVVLTTPVVSGTQGKVAGNG